MLRVAGGGTLHRSSGAAGTSVNSADAQASGGRRLVLMVGQMLERYPRYSVTMLLHLSRCTPVIESLFRRKTVLVLTDSPPIRLIAVAVLMEHLPFSFEAGKYVSLLCQKRHWNCNPKRFSI